jgi:small subunit ribosomal protein S20
MPNTKSAEKRLRQNVNRREQNKPVKSSLKTYIKKVIAAAQSGDVAGAEELYRTAAKKLDQAGSKRVVHKNATSRQKARLQRAIKRAKGIGLVSQ